MPEKSDSFITNFRKKVSSTPITVIFGILFLISQITILTVLSELDLKEVFTFQTTFSKDFVKDTIIMWRDKDLLDIYKIHFYMDFFHPLLYSIFLCSLIARILEEIKAPQKLNFLLLIPMLAGSLDILENILHLIFISDVDSITTGLVIISALAANLKWIIAHFSILLIPFLTLNHIFKGNSGGIKNRNQEDKDVKNEEAKNEETLK